MISPPQWTNRYVGIPFASHGRGRGGADCWGMLRFVLLSECAIVLPLYIGYQNLRDKDTILRYFNEERADWEEIARGDERKFDAISLSVGGWPMHVGVVVKPGLFMHTARGVLTCIDNYDSLRWTRRVLGFYRHKDAPA